MRPHHVAVNREIDAVDVESAPFPQGWFGKGLSIVSGRASGDNGQSACYYGDLKEEERYVDG